MDFKKLNEALQKFIEKEINEISDDTVNRVGDAREKNLKDARQNYGKGAGSLNTLVTAGKKLDNFKDLRAKRIARRDSKAKHTIVKADLLPRIREGRYELVEGDYTMITDEELIKLANLEESIKEGEKVISTIEEAKELFSTAEDKVYKIDADADDLLNAHHIYYNGYDQFVVLIDTKAEDAIAEINGTGSKNRKKLQKYANYGKNLMKYVAKGEVENFDWAGTENGHRNFYYSVTFKNPGWPDEESFKENTKDWKERLNRWSMPKPEPRIEGTYLNLYSNFVEHKGRITWNDDNTITISGIVGYEVEN